MPKKILVHSCYSARAKGIRPATACACSLYVTVDDAHAMVHREDAQWDGSDLLFIGTRKQTPRCETIEKAHIERAYIDGKEEDAARIDTYGELTRELWTSLLVPFQPDPFPGRPVLANFNDDRSRRV